MNIPISYLKIEISDFVIPVLTGIYSEETHRPQPLKISVLAWLTPEHLGDIHQNGWYGFNIKDALLSSISDNVHFPLIEAVADRIMETVFARCEQVMFASVKIVKLALSERHEEIGIMMGRRRSNAPILPSLPA